MAHTTDRPAPRIGTAPGLITGLRTNGVVQFRGIRYGASTGGANRFRPPQPVESWDGAQEATGWGQKAPQTEQAFNSLRRVNLPLWQDLNGAQYEQEQGEDCLTLHIWAPADLPGRPLPVMVWLHGGGFSEGTAASPRTDGSVLAREHGVVVVSVSHRLNALGFAYLPEVDFELADAVNLGMLDIVAALEWISSYIAQVGGDPENVTVFGESGGGCKVSMLMGMPLARGLFHKAIVQSGPFSPPITAASASHSTELLLTELGIELSGHVRDQLERIPFVDIVEAQEKLWASGAIPNWGYAPVLDGSVLTEASYEAITIGSGAGIPLMIGTNATEAGGFLSTDEHVWTLSDDGLFDHVETLVGPLGSELLDAYRRATPEASPSEIWCRIVGDQIVHIAAHDVATDRAGNPEAADCFEYIFAWKSPDYERLGAMHSIEAGFVFGTHAAIPLTRGDPRAGELAAAVSAAWAMFAATGSPHRPEGGSWPPASPGKHPTMILDAESRLVADPFGPMQAIWRRADIIPQQGRTPETRDLLSTDRE